MEKITDKYPISKWNEQEYDQLETIINNKNKNNNNNMKDLDLLLRGIEKSTQSGVFSMLEVVQLNNAYRRLEAVIKECECVLDTETGEKR